MDRLRPMEWYEIMQLRQDVFVIEQRCLYRDLDGKDPFCLHLSGRQMHTGKLAAYARLVPPSVVFEEASIGRVVTDQAIRGQGIGNLLMLRAIEEVQRNFLVSRIRISAQAHLQTFYYDLGFRKIGKVYDDEGIPHIDMIFTN